MVKPKLVFLVMSAIHPVQVVRELARALAPHTVLVHTAANPGFEELCKLCPGAARCKPTAARCKAAKRL